MIEAIARDREERKIPEIVSCTAISASASALSTMPSQHVFATFRAEKLQNALFDLQSEIYIGT